jgi:hypothetical protein
MVYWIFGPFPKKKNPTNREEKNTIFLGRDNSVGIQNAKY